MKRFVYEDVANLYNDFLSLNLLKGSYRDMPFKDYYSKSNTYKITVGRFDNSPEISEDLKAFQEKKLKLIKKLSKERFPEAKIRKSIQQNNSTFLCTITYKFSSNIAEDNTPSRHLYSDIADWMSSLKVWDRLAADLINFTNITDSKISVSIHMCDEENVCDMAYNLFVFDDEDDEEKFFEDDLLIDKVNNAIINCVKKAIKEKFPEFKIASENYTNSKELYNIIYKLN